MTSYILSRNGIQMVRFDATSDWSARNFALTTVAGDRSYDAAYRLHREEEYYPLREAGDFDSVPEGEGVTLATEEYVVSRGGNRVCGFRAATIDEAITTARAMVDAPYDAYRLHRQDDWLDLWDRHFKQGQSLEVVRREADEQGGRLV